MGHRAEPELRPGRARRGGRGRQRRRQRAAADRRRRRRRRRRRARTTRRPRTPPRSSTSCTRCPTPTTSSTASDTTLPENTMSHHSRRDFLGHAGLGLGAAALGGLGLQLNVASAAELDDPQAPRQPHFPAKAKSVIWLHMAGAPSTLDLFDYKPELIKLAGKPLPDSFAKNLKTATDGGVGNLLATKRTWKQYGETGAWVSDFLPNLVEAGRRHRLPQGLQDRGRDAHHLVAEAAHRGPGAGPSGAGLVGAVRARLGQPRPAGLRRAAHRRRRGRRRARRGDLELGLPARGLPGHGVPQGRLADPAPGASRRRDRHRAAQHAGPDRRAQRARRDRAHRRHRARRRARSPTSWPTAWRSRRPRRST